MLLLLPESCSTLIRKTNGNCNDGVIMLWGSVWKDLIPESHQQNDHRDEVIVTSGPCSSDCYPSDEKDRAAMH